MKVAPVSISFGYRNRLKTEWLKGNIPELMHDFYDGSLLNADTVTLEHVLPHSKGGKNDINKPCIDKLSKQCQARQSRYKAIYKS